MSPAIFCALQPAYIDPGTGAIILQMIIAGLVGVAVFFRQAIARFFGLFTRKKKHDETTANEKPAE